MTLLVFLMSLMLTTACEDFPLKHVLACLWTVISGVNDTNILAGTDTATVQAFCRDGTFNLTVRCLEDLYDNCDHHENLQDIAQPKAWHNTFLHLCDSLPVHEVHSNCIVKQRVTIQDCLHYNYMLAQRSINRHPKTQDAFILTICSYFHGLSVCTANPVRDHCDVAVGKVIEDFLTGITPQVMCQENYIYSEKHISTRYGIGFGINVAPISRISFQLLAACLIYINDVT